MCADLLALQAFDDIDPQAPLGGGDGKKDILCSKNGIRYVAAAYFPTTEKTYSEIERKFLDDLEGVKANKRDGFLFFTNQHLTIGEREKLNGAATAGTSDCQIFHIERIRALLDQPSGYGIRVQYLRIPLSPEEQFAYFADAREFTNRMLEWQGRMLGAMSAKLDRLVTAQDYIVQTMVSIAPDKDANLPPPPSRPDLFLGGLYHAPKGFGRFSADISV